MPKADHEGPPHEVAAIRAALTAALATKDAAGRYIGRAKCGIYAFYDYDNEPIYVGQTRESLGYRIRRHLTNQRTDAVAMSVLDPFEVASISMWPLWELEGKSEGQEKKVLSAAEFTVYEALRKESRFHVVLNEQPPTKSKLKVKLPKPVQVSIIPADIFERRKHSDVRIARRASTIARLAQVISERSVSKGLRQTLRFQAQRLLHLSTIRLEATVGLPGHAIEVES